MLSKSVLHSGYQLINVSQGQRYFYESKLKVTLTLSLYLTVLFLYEYSNPSSGATVKTNT